MFPVLWISGSGEKRSSSEVGQLHCFLCLFVFLLCFFCFVLFLGLLLRYFIYRGGVAII